MHTTPTLRRAARRAMDATALVLLLPCAALAQANDAAAQAQRVTQVQDDYDVGHYAAAFAGVVALADAGHAPSARIAVQMLQHGPGLYHIRFTAGPKQVQRWAQLWRCGSEAAGHDCLLAQRGPRRRATGGLPIHPARVDHAGAVGRTIQKDSGACQ